MEAESPSDNPPERSVGKLADVVGTLIALITLLLPFLIIAHFSSVEVDLLPQSTSLLQIED